MDENPDDDYEYRPVTGIFVHESDDVWTLHFENGDSLGVTASHPIYSASFNDWRLAGELQVGEEVLTKWGSVTLKKKDKISGGVVYNLEVRKLHNFLVGGRGVVVHNSCNRHKTRQYDSGFETPMQHIENGHTYKNKDLPENVNKSYFNDKFDDNAIIEDLMDELINDINKWHYKPNSNNKILRIEIDSTDPKFTGYLKEINGVQAFGADKYGNPLTRIFMDIFEDGTELTIMNMYPIN